MSEDSPFSEEEIQEFKSDPLIKAIVECCESIHKVDRILLRDCQFDDHLELSVFIYLSRGAYSILLRRAYGLYALIFPETSVGPEPHICITLTNKAASTDVDIFLRMLCAMQPDTLGNPLHDN